MLAGMTTKNKYNADSTLQNCISISEPSASNRKLQLPNIYIRDHRFQPHKAAQQALDKGKTSACRRI